MSATDCCGARMRGGLDHIGVPVARGDGWVWSADRRVCKVCGRMVYHSFGAEPICREENYPPGARLRPVRLPTGRL